MLHDLQLIAAGVAHIETLRAGYGPRIWKDFKASVAEPLRSAGQVRNIEADMTRTQRPSGFIIHREMQLIVAYLIPRARLSRSGRLGHLFESEHRAVKMFGRLFKLGRDGDVDVMKRCDHVIVSEARPSWRALQNRGVRKQSSPPLRSGF